MTDAERAAARDADAARPPSPAIADADVPGRARLAVHRARRRARAPGGRHDGPGFDLWRTEDLERFVATFRGLDLGADVVVGGNAFVQHDIVGP